MTLEKIEISHELDFAELQDRLRRVRLKGFPEVEIYRNSQISIESFSPDRIFERVFTPQPSVYRPNLDRIKKMAELFRQKGIDIFRLNGGVDYKAFDENNQETSWTLIPPVVEMIGVECNGYGLEYSGFLSPELKKAMEEKGHSLNPELKNLMFPEYLLEASFSGNKVPIICDGSHRVHTALEMKAEQNLLLIDGQRPGYPYYAAPKPYSCVHVEPERKEGGGSDKTHVLTEPGHKLLYRLFPSGGILSGDVRPTKK